MSTRIVVADESEARFYDLERLDAPLQEVGRLTDPTARLHDRDLKSDRPGRVFDHAAGATQRRGSVSHHATGGERTPRKHAAAVFADRIADGLKSDRDQHRFEHLVLIAAPAFLGLLRAALPKAVGATIVAEIPKDLIHQPESAVRAHLPRL